ncbi:alpha/beta fold hydrolase [Symbiobacterium thermophilum]|uniref:alpha/beta fold hydrolase n=1 Tax=Symbiobacterium thermophilum TaxID=2734 RepID=UPI0035C7565B
MATVTLPSGLRLFYRERGHGGQTVLLIHGNTASSLWWERVMAHLPEHVRTLAPDLRGCGDSDKPAPPWSIADLAEDVYQFTQAMGVQRCFVVGHSLGGGVAMQLAVSHPDLVERLVLINSAPAEGLVTPPERYAQLEAAVKAPELLKAALALMMPTAPKDEFYQAVLEESVQKSADALIPNGRALDGMNLVEQVGGLRVPTLILYGRQDGLVTLDMMERTRNQIPGAQLEVWPEVGHSAPVEAPERLAKRLIEFFGIQL